MARFPVVTGGCSRERRRSRAFRSPRDAKAAGVALVPKDRHAESLLPGASVRENISLPNLSRFVADPVAALHPSRHASAPRRDDIATRLAIKMPGIEAPIDSLSGGNQQKAILGRWLASGAKIFMLNSPTAAVDIGAKAEIYALIRQIAAARRRRHLHFDGGRGIPARLPSRARCSATGASSANCRARTPRKPNIMQSGGREAENERERERSVASPRKPRVDLAAWFARFGTIVSLDRVAGRLLDRPLRRVSDRQQSAQHHEPDLDPGDDGVRPDGLPGDGPVRSVDRRHGDARRLCRDLPAGAIPR